MLPQSYILQEDPRTETQKQLSVRITKVLSQINLKRITKNSEQNLRNRINKDYFHFVCLCGIPPLKNQFQNLDLPGTKVVLKMYGYDSQTQQQYQKALKQASMEKQVEVIRKYVLEHAENKKIVLIYHSFGTYLALVYLEVFKNDHRISGLIDIGGAPIRFYPVLLSVIKTTYPLTNQLIEDNKQYMYKQYMKQFDKKDGVNPMQNQYQFAIFCKFMISKWFERIFILNRNLPDILKLFIYGTSDRIFLQQLLAQKIIFYTQINKLPKESEKKYLKIFNKTFSQNATNIQQRFCISIQKGKHSLHMQKKHTTKIKAMIEQYLFILQQFYREQSH